MSVNLCFILLFVGFVRIEQVTGVITFKPVVAGQVEPILNHPTIPSTVKRGPIILILTKPWSIANNDNFYVIIYSCECANVELSPCCGEPFFTFIRLLKYDTNKFLVIMDDMGLEKPKVDVNEGVVKRAAENWLNASKPAMGEIKLLWDERIKKLTKSANDFATEVRNSISTDNILPCAGAVLGSVTYILMQGPEHPINKTFVSFISSYFG